MSGSEVLLHSCSICPRAIYIKLW